MGKKKGGASFKRLNIQLFWWEAVISKFQGEQYMELGFTSLCSGSSLPQEEHSIGRLI